MTPLSLPSVLLRFLTVVLIGLQITSFILVPQRSVGTATSQFRTQWPLFASQSGAAWNGPVQQKVEEKLKDIFEPAHLQVINESHGQPSDESHFKVIIVADAFQGKRLVQCHRMVNQALQDPDTNVLPFHALTITAKSPDQWSADSSVPVSPNCMGGH